MIKVKKKHLILPTFATVFMLSLICGCSDEGNVAKTTSVQTSVNTIATSVTSAQTNDRLPSTESPIVTTTARVTTDAPMTTNEPTATDAPITTAKLITTTTQTPRTTATSSVTTTRRGETPFVPAH